MKFDNFKKDFCKTAAYKAHTAAITSRVENGLAHLSANTQATHKQTAKMGASA